MNDRPQPAPRGAIPRGLLGMLALVVLVEAALAARDRDFSHPVHLNWEQSARMARTRSAGYEVLCLGDSLSVLGLLPRVLEDRSGYRTYNLGAVAATPVMSYLQLRRALDAGARPRLVLLTVTPFLLGQRLQDHQRHWEGTLSPAECLDLGWTARDLRFFTTTLVGHALYSARTRLEIRQAVLRALRGEARPDRGSIAVARRNCEVNRGAMIHQIRSCFDGVIRPDVAPFYFPPTWAPHPLNLIYLDRLLRLARARGIRVVWLLPPTCPEYQSGRAARGLEARDLGLVRGALERFPNVTVLDGRAAGYPHTAFIDAVHLNGVGAFALSRAVATALRGGRPGRAAAPRWVALPPYQDQRINLPLEDARQSALALLAEGGRKRR